MSYYKQSVPPVRDSRLKIGDSYAGNACDLVNCGRDGCLLQKGRGFWQANACQMALTLMMATTVENSVIVMHAPGGCGALMHSLSAQAAKGKGVRGKTPAAIPWLSTNLTEADVIGGGERKLRETIEYADREFRPEIIFVVVTCAPSIIGDDAEEVARQARSRVSADVVSLHCPGFRSRVVASAYDTFYHGIMRGLDLQPIPRADFLPLVQGPQAEAAEKKYLFQKSRTVNVWNATSIGAQDEQEVERLLTALGLKVRFFAEYSSREELRQVSEAALNVSMCNVHDDYMLKYLAEKFAVPYVIAGMPIGFRHTREWLLQIARHFGMEKEAAALAGHEEKLAREAIAPFLERVKGKTVLLCGGVVRVGAEATTLAELGFNVLGIRAYHYDEGAEPVFSDVAENLADTPVAVSNQLFEMTHQIKSLKPDLVISHNGTQGYIAKLGVPAIQLFSTDGAFFAYNGIYQILRRIVFEFKNTSYRDRLSRHIRLPYKQSYFEGDAFKYIINNST
ncbi:MAG: nitrogenase iron-molybdenum protein subunit alpha [Gracilibacteraceae bacterium]|jgi:nitrogenase molybdenum-iron protein alpha chain|nr:nitrogenase iron-molybdenum protein subunit alpha [Gracilibacteraceae bacterium]